MGKRKHPAMTAASTCRGLARPGVDCKPHSRDSRRLAAGRAHQTQGGRSACRRCRMAGRRQLLLGRRRCSVWGVGESVAQEKRQGRQLWRGLCAARRQRRVWEVVGRVVPSQPPERPLWPTPLPCPLVAVLPATVSKPSPSEETGGAPCPRAPATCCHATHLSLVQTLSPLGQVEGVKSWVQGVLSPPLWVQKVLSAAGAGAQRRGIGEEGLAKAQGDASGAVRELLGPSLWVLSSSPRIVFHKNTHTRKRSLTALHGVA